MTYKIKKYVIHIRALKQTLNQWSILKRVHRVIQFSQKAWLKPYIDMSTKLRKKQKTKITMENVRSHRGIEFFQNLVFIQQNTFQKICWK